MVYHAETRFTDLIKSNTVTCNDMLFFVPLDLDRLEDHSGERNASLFIKC